MKGATIAGALVAAAVIAQIALPGLQPYHTGWFNVGLAALTVLAIIGMRRTPFIAFGLGAVAFAGIASGLLGPDTRTIVGAPGTNVRVDEAGGTLAFPLAQAGERVMLERGSSTSPIGSARYTATAVLRSEPRTVVAIEAFDRHGAHLTITQPTGMAFLSPVLLMQSTQTIAGFVVPYDSFAVPAAHRIVRAVLFSQQQAASLPALAAVHAPVVLFDLEDDMGTSIPHGIGMAADGGSVVVGGLRLLPHVLAYPAVEVVSIPDLAVVGAGFLAILIGVLLTRRRTAG